jgi:hypothetical protein
MSEIDVAAPVSFAVVGSQRVPHVDVVIEQQIYQPPSGRDFEYDMILP